MSHKFNTILVDTDNKKLQNLRYTLNMSDKFDNVMQFTNLNEVENVLSKDQDCCDMLFLSHRLGLENIADLIWYATQSLEMGSLIPILIIDKNASDRDEFIDEAMHNGVNAVLFDPYDVEDILRIFDPNRGKKSKDSGVKPVHLLLDESAAQHGVTPEVILKEAEKYGVEPVQLMNECGKHGVNPVELLAHAERSGVEPTVLLTALESSSINPIELLMAAQRVGVNPIEVLTQAESFGASALEIIELSEKANTGPLELMALAKRASTSPFDLVNAASACGVPVVRISEACLEVGKNPLTILKDAYVQKRDPFELLRDVQKNQSTTSTITEADLVQKDLKTIFEVADNPQKEIKNFVDNRIIPIIDEAATKKENPLEALKALKERLAELKALNEQQLHDYQEAAIESFTIYSSLKQERGEQVTQAPAEDNSASEIAAIENNPDMSDFEKQMAIKKVQRKQSEQAGYNGVSRRVRRLVQKKSKT